jgi:ribonucleoside-diphosphate reductase alpha chain
LDDTRISAYRLVVGTELAKPVYPVHTSEPLLVVSVYPSGTEDKVYCFTEPKRHSGVFNGVYTAQCAEQCLPPHGACLLGSFNLPKYINGSSFDTEKFTADIPHIVRAMDNVIDQAIYPLPQQAEEAVSKRRMGLGVTGLANAIEALGEPYGGPGFVNKTDLIMNILQRECYQASSDLAAEKGSFPLYDKRYLDGKYIKTLPTDVQESIQANGIRNSHLISIAPTGTISLTADNVSSGGEPPFRLEYERTVRTADGDTVEIVADYAYANWGIKGKTANEVSIDEHIAVLLKLQQYTDSAVSKTLNVPSHVSFSEFKAIYMTVWQGGGKGATTFRDAGKRIGILREAKEQPEQDEDAGAACYIDPATGAKTCG